MTVVAQLSGYGPARVLQVVLGLALIALGTWVLAAYPVGRPWLLALGLALGLAQWRDDRAWLVALPVLLACLDLGAWSGRLLLDEVDGYSSILAGTALMAGHYAGGGGQLLRRSFAPLWLFALALAIGLGRGLWVAGPLDANAWNGYLTGWNALRVAKGAGWALVFWPLVALQLQRDAEATQGRLALGLTLSLVGFGAFILWEREVLVDLFGARNLWGLFATWLDLAGNYRVTGTSSQMHLGGEAVDGYLALAWPFAFWLLLQARRWPVVLLAAVALGLAAYAVMVTFTRTTYAAIGLAFLAFLGATLMGPGTLGRGRLAAVTGWLALSAGLFLFGYRFGGVLLILGYLAAALGGLAAGLFAHRVPRGTVTYVGLALLLALAAAWAVRAILHSKWAHLELAPAMGMVLPSILVLGIGGLGAGQWLRPHLGVRQAMVFLFSLALMLPAMTVAVSGTQIHARAITAGTDLQIRLDHWTRGLALMRDDAVTWVLGKGLGTFPLSNLVESGSGEEGVWFFPDGTDGASLRLVGTGELAVGQRIFSAAPGVYRVKVRAQNPSQSSGRLMVMLQPRRLLELERWRPIAAGAEVAFRLEPASGFQEVEGQLEVRTETIPTWYDPRSLVLTIANRGAPDSAIDVAAVRLIGPDKRDLLINGNFSAGGDRWFAYNDFQHLGWHLKSLYVAVFFDLGLLGVLAFGLVVLVALGRALGQASRGRSFAAAQVAAITGFLVLGLTGTLLDVPRLMTLFLLLVVTALWRERVRRRAKTGLPRGGSGGRAVAECAGEARGVRAV